MATVIRVKRRITEEPFDKFVLNSKRPRKNVDDASSSSDAVASNLMATDDETSTILKFSGTIKSEDDIKTHITRLTKSQAEESVRKTRKVINVTAKTREQLKVNAQNSRFKVINCFRSAQNGDNVPEDDQLTVVDVVKDDANDDVAKPDAAATSMDKDFVYDLYMVDDGEQNWEIDYNNLISIRPFDDLVYQANDEKYSNDDESEDSNDEDNWRNEYPDTDDNFSVGEDDMRRAVEDLNFGSDNDLSSDESDCCVEPVIHFREADDDLSAFEYFKKYGRLKAHAQHYRDGRTQSHRAVKHDTDSDSDAESSNEGVDASSDSE